MYGFLSLNQSTKVTDSETDSDLSMWTFFFFLIFSGDDDLEINWIVYTDTVLGKW